MPAKEQSGKYYLRYPPEQASSIIGIWNSIVNPSLTDVFEVHHKAIVIVDDCNIIFIGRS